MTRPNLALVSILSLGLAACLGGDRHQTGECPADEECSPLTPYGLLFTGVDLIGVPLLQQPKTTAIGGTQRIGLHRALMGGGSVPLDLPFSAMSDNGDALMVGAAGTNDVVIDGLGAGRDLLRITEQGTDLLFDRYECEAAALDHLTLIPATNETYMVDQPLAFYTGPVTIGIALYDLAGRRLADDSMILTAPGLITVREEWDTFSFADLPPGTITTDLTAAGRAGTLDLDVVNTLDTVQPLDDTFPAVIHVNDQGSVCFRATDSRHASIIGLPWQFSASPGVTQVIGLFANCMSLQVNSVGQFTVTASALGVTTMVTFDAVAAGAKPVRGERAPGIAPGADIRGERAQLAE